MYILSKNHLLLFFCAHGVRGYLFIVLYIPHPSQRGTARPVIRMKLSLLLPLSCWKSLCAISLMIICPSFSSFLGWHFTWRSPRPKSLLFLFSSFFFSYESTFLSLSGASPSLFVSPSHWSKKDYVRCSLSSFLTITARTLSIMFPDRSHRIQPLYPSIHHHLSLLFLCFPSSLFLFASPSPFSSAPASLTWCLDGTNFLPNLNFWAICFAIHGPLEEPFVFILTHSGHILRKRKKKKWVSFPFQRTTYTHTPNPGRPLLSTSVARNLCNAAAVTLVS